MNLGNLFADAGRRVESEGAYKQALAISEKLSVDGASANLSDLSKIQSDLGILYREMGRIDDSEFYFQESLGTEEKLAKENPAAFRPGLAGVLSHIGVLYTATHRSSMAAPFLLRALEIYKDLAQDESELNAWNVGRTLLQLGGVYEDLFQLSKDLSQLSEAERFLNEAQSTFSRIPRFNGVSALQSLVLSGLALVHLDRGDLAQAQSLFSDAIRLISDVSEGERKANRDQLVMVWVKMAVKKQASADFACRLATEANKLLVTSGIPEEQVTFLMLIKCIISDEQSRVR
jgi:tetratricopeptide (TPR) repeat protein